MKFVEKFLWKYYFDNQRHMKHESSQMDKLGLWQKHISGRMLQFFLNSDTLDIEFLY